MCMVCYGRLTNIVSEPGLQGLGEHRQPVLLIGRLGEAVDGRRLHHCLAERDYRIGDFHLQ